MYCKQGGQLVLSDMGYFTTVVAEAVKLKKVPYAIRQPVEPSFKRKGNGFCFTPECTLKLVVALSCTTGYALVG
ncbi:hypothetical protein ABBQ38_012122 [Trebouxia sp. C0009 RCD-2024]